MSTGNPPPKPRPKRNQIAASRLTDPSNGEPPSSVHQAVLQDTQMRIAHVNKIMGYIQAIDDLSSVLPPSIAEGTEDGEIHRVITTLPGLDADCPQSTFNRRFDVLFKEDAQCRKDGRLHHIRRGEYGMDLVVQYLRSIKWATPVMNLPGAEEKLVRVIKEMEFLSDMTAAEAKRAGKRKAGKSKPDEPNKVKKTAKAAPPVDPDAGDGDYNPNKPTVVLSEEEEDDDLEDPVPETAGPKKRKILLVDGVHAAPPKKKKKSTAAAAAPLPTVDVIEIDDESEEETPREGGKRGPKTQTRAHFRLPIATKEKGEKRWVFQCRHAGCKTRLGFRRTVGSDKMFADESPAPKLGNLATHVKQFHFGVPPPADAPGQTRNPSASAARLMGDWLEEGKLNPIINTTQSNFLKVFAAWIIEDDLAFTTGETDGIQRLFTFMQTRYLLPSDTTVRNTLSKMYIDMYNLVKSELAEIESKIALQTDTWTTRAMTFTFAGTIASWVTSDWELVERVIDFHVIEDKEHEGEYAALGLAKQLANFQVLEKLIAAAMDNAAPNDVLIRALSRLLREKFDVQFAPENAQVRCLSHVVHLVVQKLLAALAEATDPEVEDEYILNKDLPFHYDPALDNDLNELEREVFSDPSETDDNTEDEIAGLFHDLGPEFEKMTPLQKLRTTTTKICSSPQRRKRFRACAEKAFGNELAPSGRRLATLCVVRDVRHRWNYTQAMIERARLLRKAIDSWVLEREELRPLFLKNSEWELLEALDNTLKPFTRVTLQMSRSRTPTLPWVLPMYEYMRKHLRNSKDDTSLPTAIRDATEAASEKLEEYYSKACGCQLNTIATLLHPSLGIAWFRKMEADATPVADPDNADATAPSASPSKLSADRAKILFEHAYTSYSQIHGATNSQPAAAAARSTPGSFKSFLDDICMVDIADTAPQVVEVPETERFWSAFKGHGGDLNNPLKWWKEHEAEFKLVSCMARDFLAIPGTSVSVKHLFSSACHLCRETRASMKADTITEAMLLKMWIKEGLLKAATLDCSRG